MSGFYGSGKSHLVKMLCFLWTDYRFPDGATARRLAHLPTTFRPISGSSPPRASVSVVSMPPSVRLPLLVATRFFSRPSGRRYGCSLKKVAAASMAKCGPTKQPKVVGIVDDEAKFP